MFARIRAVVVLGLVYHATCGPVFEGNPFLQVLTTSKQPLPTPNQKANQTDLYVILPFSGQQLQQSPPVQTSAASSPAPTNHVHSFECSNPTSSLHVHSQNPILSVQQLSNSNSESAGAAQTVVNANTPELNRRCLKSTGLFLGTSCNKFVSCLNGTAAELSCPEGLVFNSEGLYCDRPENVQCNGRTSAAVPPQQVGQTFQEQQLQQHLQVSQSTGNANSVVQSFATSTPASTLQTSQELLSGSGVQQNYQQQQHNNQQYQQEHQQQHQEQQYQLQSHQQHQEQQYQQQSHQHHQHQQQYYQQQHYQQQHHQQQHQHEQQQNHQYQNHQEQQQHHHQQQQQHHQQQNQLHLSGIQHHQENQQQGSQSAANGNLLVQTPISASQPIVAAPVEIKSPPSPPTPTFTPTINPTVAVIPTTLSTPTATPLPTVVAPELKNKCLSARGQFPSTSCNKFVNCWDNIILEQECPEGFLFSARGYCDFSQNVQCGDRPVESKGVVSSSKSECPLDNGTFRDRNRCSSYFTCAADKVVARYECPEGLNFNDYLGVCDFSYRVDCSKDPLLIPGRSNTNIVAQLRRGDECPADFATYRDAKNCGVYYACVSKTIVATYQCPAGFSFNDEIGICDYAERVDCSKSPKIFQVPKNVLPQVTNDIKQKIETCTPGTMFSLNPQCTAVCLCRNGVAEIVQCPAGLAYDSKMDKCILPHLAKC